MSKVKIEIDLETFKHALRNLTKKEICLILERYNCSIDSKLSKAGIIDSIINKTTNNEITEEMYFTFRETAFSLNKNFYDGFFYKINEVYKDFSIDGFYSELIKKSRDRKGSEKVDICLLNKDENNIRFEFKRSKNRDYFDYDSQKSRIYKQFLSADIEIYKETELVYIHSKNITESKIIKTFLDKCFVEVSLLTEKRKRVLAEPKFKESIAYNWYKDCVKKDKCKINNITLHMLDLLFEFESGRSDFSNISMKSIYLKENTLYLEDNEARITDSKYGGYNLQQHKKIIEEISNGKRILGFKLEAEYLYQDEETGEEIPTTLPIKILYQDNNSLRISISSECLTTEKQDVLKQAYDNLKELFINKYVSNSILNSDELSNYLTMLSEHDVEDKESKSSIEEAKDKNKNPKKSQITWNL